MSLQGEEAWEERQWGVGTKQAGAQVTCWLLKNCVALGKILTLLNLTVCPVK
jgi:hypothetical protein